MNRQVQLLSRPNGIPQAENFQVVDAPMPELRDGQVLVRNIYLSVEPAMRGWVSAAANYSEPVAIGGVMRSFAVGRVVASKHPDYAAGEYVTGLFGWQDHAAVDAATIQRKVPSDGAPLSTALGVLGINGLTAYFALLDIGQPQPGETMVVSTAAGSVGSCAGQIDTFGYEVAIDYRSGNLDAQLAAACPKGIDIYYDNTGGAISDAVLKQLAVGARVVICGTASVASWDPVPQGPRIERYILVKRARMQGFLVFDHVARYPAALKQLGEWIASGQLRYLEDVLEGLEQAPDSIAGLYRGDNLGKRLIRIAKDDGSAL